jgi:hypothetical protein
MMNVSAFQTDSLSNDPAGDCGRHNDNFHFALGSFLWFINTAFSGICVRLRQSTWQKALLISNTPSFCTYPDDMSLARARMRWAGGNVRSMKTLVFDAFFDIEAGIRGKSCEAIPTEPSTVNK